MKTLAQKHMEQYPPRPTITKEMVLQVATELAQEHEFDENHADIAKVYSPGSDGYELGKALDSDHGWFMTADLVAILDEVDYNVFELYEAAQKDWAKAYAVQPPHPIGTKLHKGTIVGICEHHAASFTVDHGKPGSLLVIKFEKAITHDEHNMTVAAH